MEYEKFRKIAVNECCRNILSLLVSLVRLGVLSKESVENIETILRGEIQETKGFCFCRDDTDEKGTKSIINGD